MKVNRVLQINIYEKNKFYKIIDDLSFKSKNIYNYANYIIRQIFIITSLLYNNKKINEEQQKFLIDINFKVDEYNQHKLETLRIKQSQGKDLNKEYKPIKHFSKDHRSCNYDFIDYVTKYSEPFIELGSNSAQATLRVLDKNWKSFYASIKDYSKNKTKYKGRPKLPNYKNVKNGRYPLYLTNNHFKV